MISIKSKPAGISCALCLLLLGNSSFASLTPETYGAYMQAWAEQDLFSGTVLVARDSNIVFHRAYGPADANAGIANTCATRFRIGSLTKAFTAMAVLQLEQAGRLHADAALSTFIPDFPRGDEISLRMLLNHRSGIVDHTTLPDFQDRRRTDPVSLSETIATFKDLPLKFAPGSQFDYSNSNYILLGYIIEQIAQQPYGDVIQQKILAPLGMEQSGFMYYQVAIPQMARGYRLEQDRIVPALDRVMQNAHASGALYATAADLYAWDQALYTDTLLDRVRLEKINHPDNDSYTCGWAVTHLFDRQILAHMGDTEGFKSFIYRFVDDQACIILLSNFEHCPITRIAEDLAAILFDQPYQLPKSALNDADLIDQYHDYVGQYQLKPGFVFTITLENGQLFCQATGQPKFRLHPESEARFFIREFNAAISFDRDRSGNVTRLIVHQAGQNVPAQRL